MEGPQALMQERLKFGVDFVRLESDPYHSFMCYVTFVTFDTSFDLSLTHTHKLRAFLVFVRVRVREYISRLP